MWCRETLWDGRGEKGNERNIRTYGELKALGYLITGLRRLRKSSSGVENIEEVAGQRRDLVLGGKVEIGLVCVFVDGRQASMT